MHTSKDVSVLLSNNIGTYKLYRNTVFYTSILLTDLTSLVSGGADNILLSRSPPRCFMKSCNVKTSFSGFMHARLILMLDLQGATNPESFVNFILVDIKRDRSTNFLLYGKVGF